MVWLWERHDWIWIDRAMGLLEVVGEIAVVGDTAWIDWAIALLGVTGEIMASGAAA